jgi:hypothetical protein
MTINNSNNNQISPTQYVPFERILIPAEIYSMFATPVTLLAAPGAGKGYIVMPTWSIGQIYTGTAYTGGGNITLGYGGTAQLIGSAQAATILTTASSTLTRVAVNFTSIDLANVSNKSITLTNLTGAFATGTGNVRVKFLYFIIDTV